MRSTHPPRTIVAPLLAAAAALLLAVVTAGCGSGSTTLDPIAQAADATTHAGGARIAMSIQITNPSQSASVVLKGSGDLNLDHQEGELVFQLGGHRGIRASKLKGLPGGKLNFTELFAGGNLYMSSPLFDGELPGGAKWLKLDITKIQSAAGFDTGSLAGAQSDPTQYLQYLRAAGASVKDEGRETVRGAPATHYSGVIDLSRAAEELPSKDRAKLKAAMQKIIVATGASKLPVEVWIDDHHLVRRMKMAMSLKIAGKQANSAIDYELFEFGPTLAVKVPASSEVYDATQLSIAKSLGG
jgi:hypothetical protein